MSHIPHVLAIPYPAQGHVIPLLELSQCLVKYGFRVTFVNTDYNHKRVTKALKGKSCIGNQINLVSVPDGLEPWEDRNNLAKLTEAMLRVMPRKLEELIEEINVLDSQKITCVIADLNVGWAIRVAEKMKIKRAVFWPAAAACLAWSYSIPKLISDGIINNDGIPIKEQIIQLAPNMPAIDNTANLFWACFKDFNIQKIAFQIMSEGKEIIKQADYTICNSTYDLEPGAFTLVPDILPIGPLLASNRLGTSAGHFWPEDTTCLQWLDQQLPQSVIYVAFGSFTVLDKIQFQELALGLELSKRPFIWVVRPDIIDDATDAYPDGFKERLGNRGQLVGWAPQQKVLSHPSIACFMSHCGWNSTMEGISNGVRFLCWPYFAEQFLNESYICDIWKVGLKFDRSESGIITKEEIKIRVDQVFGDENIKARASELKKIALNNVREGGHSNKMFNNFIEWIKA